MTITQRRLVLGGFIAAAFVGAASVYYLSLVPATHADHDHGILNLDAGGRLLVTTRSGKTRNLVGAPGRVLVIHFFSAAAPGAAEELASLFAFERGAKDAEFALIATEPDFRTLDSWLVENRLEPPNPDALVLDPDGETTRKLNCKRPLETMFFGADGKLSSQSRGVCDWGGGDAEARVARAKAGTTIE